MGPRSRQQLGTSQVWGRLWTRNGRIPRAEKKDTLSHCEQGLIHDSHVSCLHRSLTTSNATAVGTRATSCANWDLEFDNSRLVDWDRGPLTVQGCQIASCPPRPPLPLRKVLLPCLMRFPGAQIRIHSNTALKSHSHFPLPTRCFSL